MTSRLESDQEVRDSEISSSSTLAKVQYLFFAVRTVDGQAEDLSRSSSQDRRPARRGWKELERLIRW